MAEDIYKITKAQLPLVGGLGGHNLLVMTNPENQVIHELNGLAADKNGNIKPIGYGGTDKLRVIETDGNYLFRPDL